ncbi:carbonic anhydrase family protein [Hydrogenovibrio sp. 3SP14C1]|uniref:carbonic anhydrase n=1 Tax=Hydrogenovibrio sp. 3SP14C1 TaxID=3038774 RepID=UPI002417255F|nr:carbonic anhydrase family protein [Hydrogenovibrio sp. 3SP14C1]MDG4813353.1 carbonic anhydrase family protein [Hydrogenovibrio sp. 3SP14C1]
MKKRFSFIVTLLVALPLYSVNNMAAPLIDLGAEAKKQEQKSATTSPVAKEKDQTTKVADHQKKAEEKPKAKPKPKKPPHWGYFEKEGPRYWGELAPEFATCKTGKNQSPINLKPQKSVGTTSLPGFDVYYRETALKLVNNGHTLQVNIPLGSYIKINGHRYELLQYHFHTPSEHQRDGFNYPMEMHLVHKDGDGNIAVIAILFKEGAKNKALAELMPYLPTRLKKQEIHEFVKIHPAKFFPADKKFYKYSGSLTTPPCSEGVYWMVFKQPIQASVTQLEKMHEYLGSNARPVQNLNARTLLKSWPDRNQENPVYELY